jgi:hypothetical protein
MHPVGLRLSELNQFNDCLRQNLSTFWAFFEISIGHPRRLAEGGAQNNLTIGI